MIDELRARLLLSKAKHPSLRGHARMSLRVARLVPFYEYGDEEIFTTDGASREVAERRREGFERLAERLREKGGKTAAESATLAEGLSDLQFVDAYRVPYQFRRYVTSRLPVGCIALEASDGRIRNLDGNWSYDLGGSYGVNLFGHEFYKGAMERGFARARDLGVLLGNYSPLVRDNVARLQAISGMDEVSFHMSGTEAVMQAARLARYHTGRSHLVRFCGAYHGWWDGVQAGVGNPRPASETYTLKEMDEDTIRVLESRRDIACVLVNPIQSLHPNGAPPSDGTLLASDRKAHYDKVAYAAWLRRLRDVCTRRRIVFVIDDVFMGFRLAPGGTQEYFGVRANLVTYGKTVGGGLPVGVVCGRREFMRRFREDRPGDVCLARGTFNSHPVVMATMNEFLRYLDSPEARATYVDLEARWDARARDLNARFEERSLPLRVENMVSVWTTLYLEAGRYNWLLQYYLRAEGLAPSWIGTGRFIFGHDLSDEAFAEIATRFVRAADTMRSDGFLGQSAPLSNGSIKRRVLREMLSAAVQRLPRRARGRRPSDPATRP